MTNTKNEKSSFKNRKKYFIAIITIFIFLSILLPLCFSGCASTATPDTKITPHDFDLQDIKSANSEVDPEKMMSAIMAYYNGNIELSIKLFEDILKTAPGNRKALLSLVRLLKERGEYKRATAVLSRYDARCIGSPEINNISGTMWEEKSLPLFLAGNYEEFLNEINTFSKLFSNQTRSEIRAENHFFAGWAYKNLGMQDKAIEHFSAAIRANDFFPVAHLKLGQIHYRRGDFRAAERELTEALRQDFNLTQGRPYLARAILNQGRLEEGYAALKRALAIRPWDTETKKNILEFEEQHPAIVARRAEQAQERRRIAIAPVPRTFTANPDAMPQVRIGLGNGLQEFFLKTGYNFSITDDSNNIIFRGGRDYILKIKFNNGSIDIYDENEKLLLRVNTAFHLIPESSRTTTILFDVSHSVGHQTAGQEDRAYRGRFRFIPVQGQGITIVNTLALEEYLYSVVPSEMPPSWPPEALAAQAIAARSYTLANMGRFSHRGYDLSGSILSAFYRGYTGEDIRTTRAVEETRGIFLKHNGRYVNAFYSANTGGRTEYTRSVWGGDSPVIGVIDPHLTFETNPPSPDELTRWILSEPLTYSSIPGFHFRSSYRWRLIVPREEIEARIGTNIGTITGITTMGRGNSGRVERVLVKGTTGSETISFDRIRSRLGGLRSNLFVVMPKLGRDGIPQYFIFAGAGWGHGAGMCQTGAAGMAHRGHKYADILMHFYPLAEFVRVYH